MSGPLYKWIVTGGHADHPFSDAALLDAMVRFEVALAQAQSRLGLIPERCATLIARHAGTVTLDAEALARDAVEAGSLAIPFVKALTAHVTEHEATAGRYVHFGATSQDVLDTAWVVCARKAVLIVEQDLQRGCRSAVSHARRYAGAPMLARTLLQPAAVTTVGFKCAQWAHALARARRRLVDTADESLAVALGGAVGNLAAYGEAGPKLRAELARALGLRDPGSTWHALRGDWVALAADGALAAGTMAKIARDIALMTQAEIGEAAEPPAPGRGGSTAMPHKRNPVLCMRVVAAAEAVPGVLAALLAAMPQEHERALGNWQAELAHYPDLLIQVRAASHALADLLEGLEFDEARCLDNLDALQGTIFSEGLAALFIAKLGRAEGQAAVAALCAHALETGTHLHKLAADHLTADARLAGITPADLAAAFDLERGARASKRQVAPLLEAVAKLDV